VAKPAGKNRHEKRRGRVHDNLCGQVRGAISEKGPRFFARELKRWLPEELFALDVKAKILAKKR
jgi:hypothetical protein